MTHRKPFQESRIVVHRHVYFGRLFVIEDSLLSDFQSDRMVRLRPLLEQWRQIKSQMNRSPQDPR